MDPRQIEQLLITPGELENLVADFFDLPLVPRTEPKDIYEWVQDAACVQGGPVVAVGFENVGKLVYEVARQLDGLAITAKFNSRSEHLVAPRWIFPDAVPEKAWLVMVTTAMEASAMQELVHAVAEMHKTTYYWAPYILALRSSDEQVVLDVGGVETRFQVLALERK